MAELRGFGFVRPHAEPWTGLYHALETSTDPSALLASIDAASAADFPNTLWKSYLRGLALVKLERLEEARAGFLEVYEAVRNARGTLKPEIFRLVGAALKKVGWLWRQAKDYERAYAYHSIQLVFLEKHGSWEELHDVAVSLDIDAWHLKDLRQSEIWLRRSIEFAAGIEDPKSRAQALGMSCNNLSDTLASLGRFEDSVHAADQSLHHWQNYESLAGREEFRVVRAFEAVAYAWTSWMDEQKSKGADFENARAKAFQALEEALKHGKNHGLGAEGLAKISSKISALKGA